MAAAVAVVITGCSQTSSDFEPVTAESLKELSKSLNEQGFTQQAAALSDGKVSLAEYDNAFDALSECIVGNGFSVTEPQVSPIDGITYLFDINFDGYSQTTAQAAADSCIEEHWSAVAGAFQETEPVRMDESLRQSALDCISSAGFEAPEDAATPREMMGGAEAFSSGTPTEHWRTVEGCLYDAQGELFPEIGSAQVTYR